MLAANVPPGQNWAVSVTEPAANRPGTAPSAPTPTSVTREVAKTLVVHRGGQRNGELAEVSTALLGSFLVYDGPRWLGVYRPSDPPQTVQTAHGPAQVWEAVYG